MRHSNMCESPDVTSTRVDKAIMYCTTTNRIDCWLGNETLPETRLDKWTAEWKKFFGLWLYLRPRICNVVPILSAMSSWNAATCVEIGMRLLPSEM